MNTDIDWDQPTYAGISISELMLSLKGPGICKMSSPAESIVNDEDSLKETTQKIARHYGVSLGGYSPTR